MRVQNKEKLKTQNQTLGFGLDEESKRPITVKILHEHIVQALFCLNKIYYDLWLNSGYNNQLKEMWLIDAEQNFKMQYMW